MLITPDGISIRVQVLTRLRVSEFTTQFTDVSGLQSLTSAAVSRAGTVDGDRHQFVPQI
jgi:hypothetical protein